MSVPTGPSQNYTFADQCERDVAGKTAVHIARQRVDQCSRSYFHIFFKASVVRTEYEVATGSIQIFSPRVPHDTVVSGKSAMDCVGEEQRYSLILFIYFNGVVFAFWS